ncbi:potassium channel subfamily K member 15-like [Achroia grisella]|uniref:potassium channel subfamily K member 15-like n=1 Tax=Achroia grisella TaxID=688607 RepID=UPI0027D2888D|nr:potassium channel subfamily K member 15-like [Achroia grisella]
MPRRRRPLASRIRGYIRQLLAFLFSNVGIVVLVVAYTIAGAFMFQAIEGASEMERVNHMARERNNTAQYLWQNVTLALNLFNETALKDKISFELHHYQRKVVVAVRRGWDGGRSSRQWSFSSAFLYSLTVITTIGYGHLSPRTNWGKVTTILYTLLGMPLFLLYLSNVGELLARWFKCLYALVCLCRGCPGFTRRRVARFRPQVETSEAESIERPEDWRWRYSESDVTPEYGPSHRIHNYVLRRPEYGRSVSMPQPWGPPRYPHRLDPRLRGWSEPWTRGTPETSEFSYLTFDAQSITVPLSVCVFILVGYIMFGSMIFGMWEQWDQLDGAYFCFISLSSIGFGDFVPGERVYTPRIETSFIVCSMYLMLGMALAAMCFNLMQEQVIHYVAGFKRAAVRICRCKR